MLKVIKSLKGCCLEVKNLTTKLLLVCSWGLRNASFFDHTGLLLGQGDHAVIDINTKTVKNLLSPPGGLLNPDIPEEMLKRGGLLERVLIHKLNRRGCI